MAKNQPAAFYKFFKILEFALLGLYVAKNSYGLRVAGYGLALAVAYSSLIAIAQFIKQSSLGGFFWFLGERTFNVATPGIAKASLGGRLLMRPYATFPHPNALAGFILISLILTLPVFRHKLFAICYLLFALIALMLAFSRSAWLVGFLIIFYLAIRKIRIANWGLMAFASEALVQRIELNKIALQLIKQYPLAGVGLNNFIVRLPEFWRKPVFWLQPVHNIYLLIVAEIGIVGLLIFLWFLFLTFRHLRDGVVFMTALSAILLLGLFDHYWFTLQQNQLLLAIVLGLCWGKVLK